MGADSWGGAAEKPAGGAACAVVVWVFKPGSGGFVAFPSALGATAGGLASGVDWGAWPQPPRMAADRRVTSIGIGDNDFINKIQIEKTGQSVPVSQWNATPLPHPILR